MSRSWWYRRLEPFGRIIADMERRITSLSDEHLADLSNATERPSQTNCWWAIYDAAPIVREMADAEIRRREYVKLRAARTQEESKP